MYNIVYVCVLVLKNFSVLVAQSKTTLEKNSNINFNETTSHIRHVHHY